MVIFLQLADRTIQSLESFINIFFGHSSSKTMMASPSAVIVKINTFANRSSDEAWRWAAPVTLPLFRSLR